MSKRDSITLESVEVVYRKTNDVIADARWIVEESRRFAHTVADQTLVRRNWALGKRIAEEELGGEGRADYGKATIAQLAETLTAEYGRGFSRRALYQYLSFYRTFPQIVYSASTQSSSALSWTHYRTLLQVHDPKAREWYAHEAADQSWAVKTLQRNISSQYYERMLLTQHPDLVRREMERITEPYQQDKLEFIHNPVIAEFMGLSEDNTYQESDLESAIITHLQKFLMELGKGYAFVARQQRIHTEKCEYFIDLVFYNYILKCFVLIDLKTGKVTHQDVGQMDMYVRMYDELRRTEGDNPTLGIVLCADTDEDIARYSVLHGSEQLFATKYRLCLPTDEQLRSEIEAQKTFFALQQAEGVEEEEDKAKAFASGMANTLMGIYDQAYQAYAPLTDDICSRTASENEVDLFLDRLLDFAGYEPCHRLFKRVCDCYRSTYPDVVDMHVRWYFEEFEEGGVGE
ncbi:MAG: PDDEXK nuclease domain-containing protein [Coriobacteriales bacterium]|nr:PDDEXK nuclease domain-containing protein [Coriobacteriales bacterium]